MRDHYIDNLDELARRSPVALAAMLQRALESRDRDLERQVLTALARLGIVLVDRGALTDALAAGGRR